MKLKYLSTIAGILFTAANVVTIANAQGTLEDYNRAYALPAKYSASKVKNLSPDIHWVSDNSFWWTEQTDNGKKYLLYNVATKKNKPLFDAGKLATLLSKASATEASASNLGLRNLRVNEKGDVFNFEYNGKNYEYSPKGKQPLVDKGAVEPYKPGPHWMVVDEEREAEAVVSPDGTREAFIKDGNIWVRTYAGNVEKQMTFDGSPNRYYSAYIQWSPDGTMVTSNRIMPVEKRYVHYVESSPKNSLQPILHTQEYAKPGDALRSKTPVIVKVDAGEVIIPDNSLFASQYDLYGPIWNSDNSGITFEYNERGHKNYRVLELSATTGEVSPIIEESHPKYVNYSRIYRNYLGDGRYIIWSSERDNYNHLYLYDRQNPAEPFQITSGPWYVRRVVNVDEQNRKIYFTANGMNPEEDPYYIRYYSINFDGTGLTDLTPAPGTHRATFSPDYKYLADTYSTPSTAPVTVIRSAIDGKELATLVKADISALLAEGWEAPEQFAAPGRDGETLMYGLIYRPTNFDPSRKYPIIEYIYQGPGDQYVPKSFIPFNNNMSALAELGFIVVMVDGMGTSFRSREFENICYKNLVDAGLPDHIAWIKHAAEKYPYMDIDKVGIFGASAGGQESTTAVLHHPEFYKAAYSACGCHDNRMDKIWWNEQWLGYPIDESYIEASNVENAHLLSRPLMLVVGELDDNVDPASTMQVANALIKANKDFELVVLPGERHTLGGAFGQHKRYDFFVRHLMGVEPPAWSEIKY